MILVKSWFRKSLPWALRMSLASTLRPKYFCSSLRKASKRLFLTAGMPRCKSSLSNRLAALFPAASASSKRISRLPRRSGSLGRRVRFQFSQPRIAATAILPAEACQIDMASNSPSTMKMVSESRFLSVSKNRVILPACCFQKRLSIDWRAEGVATALKWRLPAVGIMILGEGGGRCLFSPVSLLM